LALYGIVSFILWPLDRRLGGPQSHSGHGGKEKYSQPLLGLKPLVIQPVAQHCTTELSWLGWDHVERRALVVVNLQVLLPGGINAALLCKLYMQKGSAFS